MLPNTIKGKLAAGEVAFGTFITLKDPAIVEMFGNAGYDFVIIDLEHASTTLAQVEALSRAAIATGVTPLVRVPRNDTNTVLRIVESGIAGIVAPHITTAAEAKAIVDAAKYRPVGDRGIDPSSRSAAYGLTPMKTHMEETNANLLVMVFIEDVEAIANLDEICNVPGVDGGIVGPSDLSRSLGLSGQIDHPEVQAAIDLISDKFLEHGLISSRPAYNDSEVRSAIDKGATMITSPVIDSLFISRGIKDHMTKVRGNL